LVHVVQRLPVLRLNIEQMNFPISVCVLTSDQKNFTR
jgi:hypothetical protein